MNELVKRTQTLMAYLFRWLVLGRARSIKQLSMTEDDGNENDQNDDEEFVHI